MGAQQGQDGQNDFWDLRKWKEDKDISEKLDIAQYKGFTQNDWLAFLAVIKKKYPDRKINDEPKAWFDKLKQKKWIQFAEEATLNPCVPEVSSDEPCVCAKDKCGTDETGHFCYDDSCQRDAKTPQCSDWTPRDKTPDTGCMCHGVLITEGTCCNKHADCGLGWCNNFNICKDADIECELSKVCKNCNGQCPESVDSNAVPAQTPDNPSEAPQNEKTESTGSNAESTDSNAVPAHPPNNPSEDPQTEKNVQK